MPYERTISEMSGERPLSWSAIWAGAVTALAVALTLVFGLGVFVVPLMVRSDVQRLLGVPPGDSDSTR